MRFTSSTLAAIPAFILASSSFTTVTANECTCPSQWDGSNNNAGNGGGDWTPQAKPIQYVPKMDPSPANINDGTHKAIQQLQDKNILPPAIAGPVHAAIDEAIKKHTEKVVRVEAEQSGVTTTFTVTPTATVIPTTVTVANGSISTAYVTTTVTAMPPGATILSNQTIDALDNIEDAIRDAIAAVDLSKTGLDAAAQSELQTCLDAVLENGGLPAGYSCISQTGSTSAGLKTTFNNILEQFLGILPAQVIDNLQDAVMPMLSNLLPGETTLLDNINSAIASVVSSLSGNSVTAIEMMQSCYSLAIRQNSNTSYLQCYMSDGGPYDTLNTAMNSVIQQFVGYLPGTLLDSVQNLTSSTLKAGSYPGMSGIGSNLTAQLDAALASVTSSLTGNSVTLMQELQACANKLLKDGDEEAAKNCISQSPAASARTMVNSVAQQFSGYIPSAFFSDLVSIISNMTATGQYTETQLVTALDQAFNNANMGPAYVGCFAQVQDCILDEIRSSGNISSTCAGPVAGCELIGSNNSTTLANTTAESAPIPASEASNTTILPLAVVDNSTSTDLPINATVIDSSAPVPASSTVSVSESETAPDSSSEAPTSTSASASDSSVEATSIPASASDSSVAPSSTPASEEPVATTSGTIDDASDAPASTPTQRLRMRSHLKRSHPKLRVMYDDHYRF